VLPAPLPNWVQNSADNVTPVPRAETQPADPGQWTRGEPLWKLAPKRDAEGHPYVDFMMYAPGLKKCSAHEVDCLAGIIRKVLSQYAAWVVFADFNLRFSVLWVSLRHRRGIMTEIVAALRTQAPILKLVAHNPEKRG
jgi:hypothetical protein